MLDDDGSGDAAIHGFLEDTSQMLKITDVTITFPGRRVVKSVVRSSEL